MKIRELMARDPAFCQWFLQCRNRSTGTRPHPILGDVPTCDRCAAFVDSIDASTR